MQLETERMAGRPFFADDWPDLRLIHGDPRAMDTLSADGKPFDEDTTQRSAQTWHAHWLAHDFGLWHFSDKATGKFCGYAGQRHLILDGQPCVELAYAIVPEFWRQGRASELARACVDDLFGRSPLDVMVCLTLTRNEGSQKVMQSAGFEFERNGERVGLPHVFYRLTREMWVKARA